MLPEDSEGWEPLPKTADPGFPTAPCPKPLGLSGASSKKTESTCDILGCALKTSSENSNLNPQPEITQELLHTLVTTFPMGHIFDLDDMAGANDYLINAKGSINCSQTESKTIHDISKRLARHLPEANTVLFFPLWDWNKSRWLSGTLVWVRGKRRPLGMEELHYFKVFGDSIISEVSRIHWTATEKSKFDFTSSISHELRSPLHGILASVELLQKTPLQSAQHDMIMMINASGMALLDTTDHLYASKTLIF